MAKMHDNATLKEFLDEKGTILPGSDVFRSSMYSAIPVMLMFVLSDFVFQSDIEAFELFKKISFLLLLASITSIYLSMYATYSVLGMSVDKIERYFSIFWGKILIGISVLMSILVVCIWVVVLGGVLSSPFAAILSMTPFLTVIQLLRDTEKDRGKVYKSVEDYWVNIRGKKPILGHRFVKLTVISIGIAQILLVVLTLTVSEILVFLHYDQIAFLRDALSAVAGCAWYMSISYFMYYFSIFIAVFGLLPSSITRRLIRKLF